MPNDRFFYNSPLIIDETITLEGAEYHHLAHVTRAKVGEEFEVVNGCGEIAIGKVLSLGKRSGELIIREVKFNPPESFPIVLAQAIPRMNRLDNILEKGTELGVTEFYLFPGIHSERKDFSESQLERLQSVTIAAMKQSGRLYLPKIIFGPPLLQWNKLGVLDVWDKISKSDNSKLSNDLSKTGQSNLSTKPNDTNKLPFCGFYGDISPSAPSFIDSWYELSPKQGVILFVGPESGFSDSEEKKLQNLGAYGVTLNKNILRTDTAAISMVALAAQMI